MFNKIQALALAASVLATGVVATPSFAASTGINALIGVSQMKANHANDNANGAANLAGQQGGAQAARPKSDQIDLSVCDLATFDFDKCLN
jgi:hypothetical protein